VTGSVRRALSGRICLARSAESLICVVCQAALKRKELEMSTPAKVQVNAQVDALVFQRFTPGAPVKIVTFAASWQILDAWRHRA
jgi:hypothetical protein